MKIRCNETDLSHTKNCRKCQQTHLRINIRNYFPLQLSLTEKSTNKSTCLASSLEIFYLMKHFRVKLLKYSNHPSQFFSSLQNLYVSLHKQHSSSSSHVDHLVDLLNNDYDYVVIEDIFDAMSIILNHIHNSNRQCASLCPVHEAFICDLQANLTCSCGLTLSYTTSYANYYQQIYLSNSSKCLKQFSEQSGRYKCWKCEGWCNKNMRALKACNYIMFKLIPEMSEVLNPEELISERFALSELFTTSDRSEYRLLLILYKKKSIFYYMIIEDCKFYSFRGEFFDRSQAFKYLSDKSIAIVGLVYEKYEDD